MAIEISSSRNAIADDHIEKSYDVRPLTRLTVAGSGLGRLLAYRWQWRKCTTPDCDYVLERNGDLVTSMKRSSMLQHCGSVHECVGLGVFPGI